ncbi:hypothetical protein ACFL0Q_08460 [Thermodesulfobacteriota bacterium]
MIFRFITIGLLLCLSASMPAPLADQGDKTAEQENYCKDPRTWGEWDALVAKYPDDMDVQALHALRIGLCMKIEQGSISLQEAIQLFDRAHKTVIRKRQQEAEESQGDKL